MPTTPPVENQPHEREEGQVCTYLHDTYLDHIDTPIVALGSRDGRQWVAVRQCLFHPQGGGQPADKCWLDHHEIVPVRDRETGLVLASFVADDTAIGIYRVGQLVGTRIDLTQRLHNAAHHTTGHLVEAAGRAQGWTLTGNIHFPGQARIEFAAEGTDARLADEAGRLGVSDELREFVMTAVDGNLQVSADTDDAGVRTVRIGDLHAAPCGGTHLRGLGEIADITIPAIKIKRGRIRVSYSAVRTCDERPKSY